jgi:predicted DNA-binding transcriptional regulator AlpA
MNGIGSAANLVEMPYASPSTRVDQQSSPAHARRLLDVSEVAEWLGVSKGWVRDHASGRRQPRLFAIKLGAAKGKGLWKFREEDVHQFIQDQHRRY